MLKLSEEAQIIMEMLTLKSKCEIKRHKSKYFNNYLKNKI